MLIKKMKQKKTDNEINVRISMYLRIHKNKPTIKNLIKNYTKKHTHLKSRWKNKCTFLMAGK